MTHAPALAGAGLPGGRSGSARATVGEHRAVLGTVAFSPDALAALVVDRGGNPWTRPSMARRR